MIVNFQTFSQKVTSAKVFVQDVNNANQTGNLVLTQNSFFISTRTVLLDGT
jgi:hypothetical protein